MSSRSFSGVNRFESQPTVTCDDAVFRKFCELSEDNIQASSDLLATTNAFDTKHCLSQMCLNKTKNKADERVQAKPHSVK
jgi:hypothetical protein